MTTLLIANRGEIARRVIGTARRLGWYTVAIHTALDGDALHVRDADHSVLVESYLDIDAVVADITTAWALPALAQASAAAGARAVTVSAAGSAVSAGALYRYNGAGTGLPVTPNGGNINLTFAATGIARL